MHRTDGLRGVLSSAPVYSAFQRAVGASRVRRWLVDRFGPLAPGTRIVDVGCGPGDLLDFLPKTVEYFGFDVSERYIREARRRFARRPLTRFERGSARSLMDSQPPGGADIVACVNVLHHLDEAQTIEVLEFARHALGSTGRLFGFEPCYLDGQSRLSKWIMELDRGGGIRTPAAWQSLTDRVFPGSRTQIVRNQIRLPYVHILIEAGGDPR